MTKNIIFCADGTWNCPQQDDNHDGCADPTNVFKLFLNLQGTLSTASLLAANEQEKQWQDGAVTQIAKYLHGVGDSRNWINKTLGGNFGAGIISRIVRGYTFISRHYEPDANIYILGFSRGAYTARALAGLIVSQGVLSQRLCADQELAYRSGAQAWYRYRQTGMKDCSYLQRLAEISANLPAFIAHGELKAEDLVAVERIAAVAVWETVGSLGLPDYTAEGREDVFKFVDLKLSPKVERGFHAVSLDEQRTDFTPTLWEPDTHVLQMLFAGAHSDVGGGYPSVNNESGLSDITLQWMTEQLRGRGICFSAQAAIPLQPDPGGKAHKPWKASPWNLPGFRSRPRKLPDGLLLHPSIQQRMELAAVYGDPQEKAGPYAPVNLPKGMPALS